MPSGFKTPLDIANHACTLLGVREITSFTDTNSVASKVFNTLYDKLRGRELERNWWKFSIRRSIARPVTGSTFLLTPPTYNSGSNYNPGVITSFVPTIIPGDGDTLFWQADAAITSGGSNPDVAAHWHRYVGPIVGDVYSSSTSYFAGELVIIPATYAGGTTYALGDIVTGPDALQYVSLQASNTGHTPATNATWWQPYTTWIATAGDQWPNYVAGYAVYMSLTSSNTTPPPTAQWLATNATVDNLRIVYPLGAGPAWDVQTMNIYRLPYGFDRPAPRYLFQNDIPFLGADVGPYADDLNIEGDYIVTESADPLLLRFSADLMDVTEMAGMFCVGLAAEMAWHGCERITQSTEKKAEAKAAYEEAMNEARLINAFLTGDKKQPISQYIAVRI